MADLSTDDQRWTIYELFTQLRVDAPQMRATATQILKLDYLSDMRELTSADADELISELRRALAAEQVSND